MLELVFDTKSSRSVYVSEQPAFVQKVLIALIFLFIIPPLFFLVFVGIVGLAGCIGSLLHPWLGNLLIVLAIFPAFLLAVFVVSLIVWFIRFKVITTYGYMRFQEKNANHIECCFCRESPRTEIVSLAPDARIESYQTADGLNLVWVVGEKRLDLSQWFSNKMDFFNARTSDASSGKSKVHRYPTDEVLAAWLGVDLIRDGEKVSFNAHRYLF